MSFLKRLAKVWLTIVGVLSAALVIVGAGFILCTLAAKVYPVAGPIITTIFLAITGISILIAIEMGEYE